MKKTTYLTLFVVAVFAMGVGPCGQQRLTRAQALEALDEAALSSQAMSLVGASVEITTNFTIGQAVEAAAEELQEFIESQLPCAEITIDGASMTMEYGALPGNCTYNGHTYNGTHSITIVSASWGSLEVLHEWNEFTNGVVTVSGTASVTWSAENGSRRVVHELTWTRLSDGKTGVGSGDRMQTALDGEIFVGIKVDGDRSWVTESNEWLLDIDNVEARWEDPVPQSGSYILDTPFDVTVSLSFERVDEDTIAVTLSAGNDDYTFDVTQSGEVED